MNKPTSKLIALFFSACVISGTGLLSSCSKDDDDASVRPEVEIPTEFSELTVEQNKAKLEDNGITLVNKMTSLKNAAGIQSSISMNHFLSFPLPEGGRAATNNKAVKMMLLLSKFGIGKAKAAEVLKGFRTREEDPSTAQEVFDEYKGTYAWNKTTQAWVYTAGSDKIIFQFPSTETGTSNNAEFAIYGYASVQVVNELVGDEGYEGDVPTALKADLTVGGVKQIEYSFAASYKNNGDPTSVVTSVTIGAFKLAFEAKNTTSEVGVNYSLTENGTNLISFGAGASGNFNSDNIDAENPTDLVTSGSAYFQLMNIKFASTLQIKSLADALEAAITPQQEAAAYNTHVKLVVFYADNQKKIADTEFYVVPATDIWEEETVEIRLIFADGTPADIDNYTGDGFDEIRTEWDKLIEDLEADLG
jgi:hypothetical protein